MRHLLLALGLVSVLPACVARDVSSLELGSTGEALKDIPISADLDILFVIDDSPSTADKQKLFARNFPAFMAALDAFPTGRPSLHVGVTSSTVGVGYSRYGTSCQSAPEGNGLLRGTACGLQGGRYLEDLATPTGRQTNYAGDLATTFACMATLGDSGCGFEHHLEGMKRALDGSHPENAGFLRPGAYLAVVILGDEDDCSARDRTLFDPGNASLGAADDSRCLRYGLTCDTEIAPAAAGTYDGCVPRLDSYLETPRHYADFLQGLKGDEALVVGAVIAGDVLARLTTELTPSLRPAPTCHTTIDGNDAAGRPAYRLEDFVHAFGERGQFASVCQPDYSQTLRDIGDLIFRVVSPCLDDSVDPEDRDPTAPGLQLACQVSDVTVATGLEQALARCDMADAVTPAAGARPCWWVMPQAPGCHTTSKLELHVERTGAAPPSTHVKVRCATR